MKEENRRDERREERRRAPVRHERVSPIHTRDQEAPEDVRPPTPDEEAGQSLEELEEPPQTEGPR